MPVRPAPLRRRLRAAAFVWAAAFAGQGLAQEVAPLLEGLGAYRASPGSRSAKAQRYLDQGFVMTFGFNPEEGARAFEAAARIDPACALCWWGLGWSLGPSINADMGPQAQRRVAAALAQARRTAPRAGERTRALVEALARRHPARGAPEALDEAAYEKAMAALARRYPRDAEIAFLAAEALLNLHPYDWWEDDGRPKPWTGEIERRLTRALALAPNHPGALHYWVHLQESSDAPAKAQAQADRLRDLVPGSPHLLHMPAHIDMRTGRYAEASAANERSIEADRRYLEQVDAQGAYRVGYAAHNHHFLWASAAMQGRSRVAIAAAREAWTVACGPNANDYTTATLQHLAALPLYALVRFERWDEILRGTLPPDTPEPYPLAVFHFARGTAFARTGQGARAREELARLSALAADPRLAKAKVKNINTASSLAAIARATLEAEIARAEGDRVRAVERLREATRLEDGLAYDEPHLWLAPTRHALGAALLAIGRHDDAARVYREDLAHYPDNGWSLSGLAAALRGAGRADAAAQVDAQARAAWRHADVPLAGSRM